MTWLLNAHPKEVPHMQALSSWRLESGPPQATRCAPDAVFGKDWSMEELVADGYVGVYRVEYIQ